MLKKEWKNLFKNKFLIVALIAIITIPTIYTTLFLGSMWDPYGKVDNLPVAVVNEDKPVTYEGKDVNVGEKFVDKLKDNDSLAFNFVDKETATNGLENGTYYMVITVPQDFSKNATTLLDKNPKKMVLEYATNPAKNYIASKMSQSALSKIQTSIANSVTETYAQTVFEQFESMGDSLDEAADGSLELKDGLTKLEDGGVKISDGLNTLSESMLTFTDGTTSLSKGLDTYLSGVESLSSASKELAAGASTLNSSVQGISIPSVELTKEQKNTIKNTAASSVSSYADKLSSGIGSAVSNKVSSTLTADATVSAVSSAILKDTNIAQMVGALQSVGYTKEQAQSLVVGIVSNTLKGVSGNITADSITNSISPTVSSTIGQIAGGAAEKGALAVASQVNSNLSSYEEMFTTLKSATKTLSDGLSTLSTGADKLNAGANKLVANNSALKSGMSSLSSGANKISSGVNELHTGSVTLTDGLKTASEGTETLQSGLSEGANKLKDKLEFVSDSTSDMFSAPVDSKETQISTVPDNGHAMAAYIMIVGLWVGAMAFCSVYPISKQKGQIKSGFGFWLGKASIMYPVMIIGSLVMVGALSYFNGFNPVNLGETLLIASLSAVTFVSMLYLLNVVFGVVGRFLGLVLMIVQLSGATGTYPVELSGEFVGKITNYLPFTHVVKAFRESISGSPVASEHFVFLGVVAIVSIILTITFLELKVRTGNDEDLIDNDYDEELAV